MTSNQTPFKLKEFYEINSADLYKILKLRSSVFVLEQNCAYLDLDDFDQQAYHLYLKSNENQVIAYARILPPECCGKRNVSIGRVVVDNKHRQEKLGIKLMKEAIVQTQNLFEDYPIIISAQTYLSKFYQNMGFINTGHFYLEDDIPHQEMLYKPQ